MLSWRKLPSVGSLRKVDLNMKPNRRGCPFSIGIACIDCRRVAIQPTPRAKTPSTQVPCPTPRNMPRTRSNTRLKGPVATSRRPVAISTETQRRARPKSSEVRERPVRRRNTLRLLSILRGPGRRLTHTPQDNSTRFSPSGPRTPPRRWGIRPSSHTAGRHRPQRDCSATAVRAASGPAESTRHA